MAGGIIARLKANGLNGKVPVTGQDASVEGLQAILAGDQCMTVYKAIKKEADAAAELAISLINGEDGSELATGDASRTPCSARGGPVGARGAAGDLLGQRQGRHRRRLPDRRGRLHRRVAAACTEAGIS